MHVRLNSNKQSDGSSQWLVINRIREKEYSPILALKHYCSVKPNCGGIFFCSVSGIPIDRIQLVSCLKAALTLAGFDHTRYNSHSLRIGRTTDLALEGISYDRIRLIARWSSDAFFEICEAIFPDTSLLSQPS